MDLAAQYAGFLAEWLDQAKEFGTSSVSLSNLQASISILFCCVTQIRSTRSLISWDCINDVSDRQLLLLFSYLQLADAISTSASEDKCSRRELLLKAISLQQEFLHISRPFFKEENSQRQKDAREKNLHYLRMEKEFLKIFSKVTAGPNWFRDFDRESMERCLEIWALLGSRKVDRMQSELNLLERQAADSDAPPQKNLPFGGQPFVLTSREAAGKRVFASGHRLPSMTIEEYLERERAVGGIVSAAKPSQKKAESEKEILELYDSETIYQLRDFDEYKDDHKKGSGNRAGIS